MTVGETLLKFTDYPFAYTVSILGAKILGFSISQNQFLILGIAGAFGTFLTIIDLPAFIVRRGLLKQLKKNPQTDNSYDEKLYARGAIKTRAINIEADKIGSLFYFTFGLGLFILAIWISPTFATSLEIKAADGVVIHDYETVRDWSSRIAFAVLGILAYIAIKRWKELDDKLLTAGFYRYAVGNPFATTNSIENMSRFLDENDWDIAKDWKKKIQSEITNKASKREVIIKAADNVFAPLNSESRMIDNQISSFESTRTYSQLPRNEWDKIISNSSNVLILDTDLKQRINQFYGKINDYNYLFPRVVNETTDMINNTLSSIYGRRMQEIFVNVVVDNRVTGLPLVDCALFNKFPTDVIHGSRIQQISAQIVEDNGNKHSDGFNDTEHMNKFSEAWGHITSNLVSNKQLSTLKIIIHEIQTENVRLHSKYEEMIEWQTKI